MRWGLGPGGAGLSGVARRGLARAGALALSQLPAGPERPQRLHELVQPANEALNAPSDSPALLHALDVYAGLADGVQVSDSQYNFLNYVRLYIFINSVIQHGIARNFDS